MAIIVHRPRRHVRGHSHAMKTYVAKPTDRERNWLIVDATGLTLLSLIHI